MSSPGDDVRCHIWKRAGGRKTRVRASALPRERRLAERTPVGRNSRGRREQYLPPLAELGSPAIHSGGYRSHPVGLNRRRNRGMRAASTKVFFPFHTLSHSFVQRSIFPDPPVAQLQPSLAVLRAGPREEGEGGRKTPRKFWREAEEEETDFHLWGESARRETKQLRNRTILFVVFLLMLSVEFFPKIFS